MKIGIIAISATSGAAISELINQISILDKKDKLNDYYIFFSRNYSIFINKLPARFIQIHVPILPSNNLIRSILAQILLPLYIKRFKIDLIYCMGNIALLFSSAKTILLIQNATPFSRVRRWSFFQRARNKILAWLTILSARKADLILYVSRNSRQLFNAQLKIEPEKTRILYHSWYPQSIISHPSIKLISDNNILYVGSVFPYKNMEVTMEAFNKVAEFNGNLNLVILGSILDKGYYHKLNSLKHKLKHGERIRFLGEIEYKYVFWFYTKSKMLIFSSLEETFGLPLVEAMGMALPIIAADTRLISEKSAYFNPAREICREAALYYNPFDVNDLAAKMLLILKNDQIRNKLQRAALKQVALFNKINISNELLRLFKSLGERRNIRNH